MNRNKQALLYRITPEARALHQMKKRAAEAAKNPRKVHVKHQVSAEEGLEPGILDDDPAAKNEVAVAVDWAEDGVTPKKVKLFLNGKRVSWIYNKEGKPLEINIRPGEGQVGEPNVNSSPTPAAPYLTGPDISAPSFSLDAGGDCVGDARGETITEGVAQGSDGS